MVINEMLKFGLNILVPAITKLFNLVLKSGNFPSAWNTNFQVPLFKKGDPLSCDNYRGISITSCLGKVFTSLLAERVQNFLSTNNMLSIYQTAFRKKHGTNDHIFILKTVITKYVKRLKLNLYCCFIDFRKAFDSVWRNGLLLKMRYLGIGGKLYKLLNNMYSNTTSCVKLPQGITESFNSKVGIIQGNSLSPILFIIFIDDISRIFCPLQCDAVSLDTIKLNSLTYADDLLILSSSSIGLQNALDQLQNYSTKWGLEINTDKTKVMVFRTAKKELQCTFFINGSEIEIVSNFSYLGIIFTTNGKFTLAIKDLKNKGMRASFKIYSILKSQKINNPMVSLKLFDSMVKPILLYSCPVWGYELMSCQSKDIYHIDKIPFEQVQNKYCKILLNVGKLTSNMASRAELGRYPLLIDVAIFTIKLWINILNSPEKLLFKAYQEEIKLDECGIRNWVTFVRNILESCGLSKLWEHQTIPKDVDVPKKINLVLKKQYENTFFNELNSTSGISKSGGNKLRTYAKIKDIYEIEPYMSSTTLSIQLKRAIAQIRTSSHDLEIERGRRHRPKPTPANERFCKKCIHKVEDETHFISECPLYTILRTELLPHTNISQSPNTFFSQIFKSREDSVLRKLAIYITRAQLLRKETLYKLNN